MKNFKIILGLLLLSCVCDVYGMKRTLEDQASSRSRMIDPEEMEIAESASQANLEQAEQTLNLIEMPDEVIEHTIKMTIEGQQLNSVRAFIELWKLRGINRQFYQFLSPQEIIRILHSCGFDLNEKNEKGNALLHILAEKNEPALIEILLRAGADVNRTNRYGRLALLYASMNGHKEVVNILLRAGSDVNKADLFGVTALHMASKNGHKEIVEMLLRAGADVNKTNNLLSTPLCFASKNGHEKIVEILLRAGADVNKADNLGCTPLYWASFNGHSKIAEMLLRVGATGFKKIVIR